MKSLPLICSVFLVCALLGCQAADSTKSLGKPGGGRGGDQPAPVIVAEVVQKAVPVELRTFGNVEPVATVEVKSQVTGELLRQHFEQGQDVAKGDLLFTIDSRPARAEAKAIEANLARDKVQAANALAEATRQEELFARKLVSQELYEKARADADALRAILQADEAAVESARLRIAYSAIRSPIDGRTGEVMVHPGNLVRANEAVLVTINQMSPIRVAFALPQRELPSVSRPRDSEALPVLVAIPGDEGPAVRGAVVLVDNAVERATGTIKVWAEFDNTERRLWPGQLVDVVLTLRQDKDAIAIPSRAVETGQKGAFVFVAKADNTVEVRLIEIAHTHGDETVVRSGLAKGERVVTDGGLRLRPGAKIAIRPAPGSGSVKP